MAAPGAATSSAAFGAAAADGVAGGRRSSDSSADWVATRAGRGGRDRRNRAAPCVPATIICAPSARARSIRQTTSSGSARPEPSTPTGTRWGLSGSVEPLGTTASPELASLPTDRLADHLRTTRHLDAARARLGRGEPVERGPRAGGR